MVFVCLTMVRAGMPDSSCTCCTHVILVGRAVNGPRGVVSQPMHNDIVSNRTSRLANLLREAWREDGKVRKRTVANLTGVISEEQALTPRRVLKGETLVAPGDAFEVTRSLPRGHVLAVLLAMTRLGVENLLTSKPSKERSLITALIAFRVVNPKSELATMRAWNDTTLAAELGVPDADEHAMDWLVSRQERIEWKLAARLPSTAGEQGCRLLVRGDQQALPRPEADRHY